jgi:hypothetical protein
MTAAAIRLDRRPALIIDRRALAERLSAFPAEIAAPGYSCYGHLEYGRARNRSRFAASRPRADDRRMLLLPADQLVALAYDLVTHAFTAPRSSNCRLSIVGWAAPAGRNGALQRSRPDVPGPERGSPGASKRSKPCSTYCGT